MPGNWHLCLKLLWDVAGTASGGCINPSFPVTPWLPTLPGLRLFFTQPQAVVHSCIQLYCFSLFAPDLHSLMALAVASMLVLSCWRGSWRGQEFPALSQQGGGCSGGEWAKQRWCFDQGMFCRLHRNSSEVASLSLVGLYVSVNHTHPRQAWKRIILACCCDLGETTFPSPPWFYTCFFLKLKRYPHR